jgi:putative phosphoribosyl transferase
MKMIDHSPLPKISKYVRIPMADGFLLADLELPAGSPSLVLFANDGSCRNHPRHQRVAWVLRDMGLGTLLCDLLTDEESAEDEATHQYRNNVELLANRLIAVTKWAATNPDTKGLRIGYFGTSAGGAAAVMATTRMCHEVGAIVARDGRLDLAPDSLSRVTCPTLLISGSNDTQGIEINRQAIPRFACRNELLLVPGASRRFGEPGTLMAMARLAANWFHHYLKT